jgi:hypothetical protein
MPGERPEHHGVPDRALDAGGAHATFQLQTRMARGDGHDSHDRYRRIEAERTQPIEVRVTDGVGYVRYGDDAAIAETQDVIPSCSVAADLDASGQIIAIEILFPSDAAIATVARDYNRLLIRPPSTAIVWPVM